ncbi:MAG: DNA-3-methyladenine glycosylase family protein, partial [Flavobacteriales bacterium]
MMKRLDREFRAHLAESDPDMYRLVKPNPTLALPAPRPPFEGLVRIVAGQQLSVKAASTVFARVTEACGGIVSPETVQRCGHLGLRAAGLSQAKVLSVLALADYAGPEANRLLRACEKPWAEIRPELLAVRGIGPWSADMFAM